MVLIVIWVVIKLGSFLRTRANAFQRPRSTSFERVVSIENGPKETYFQALKLVVLNPKLIVGYYKDP